MINFSILTTCSYKFATNSSGEFYSWPDVKLSYSRNQSLNLYRNYEEKVAVELINLLGVKE